MKVHEFLRPRFTGDRFQEHSLPLEMLRDLAVLEEMIVEVAKWKYLQENPKRKRSPRRFTEGISLKLTGIEDGSAVPIIASVVSAATLFPLDNQEYFEKARDAVIAAISAAEHNEPIAGHLPDEALAYFDRFGRSLREGEAIEFSVANNSDPARLTRDTRRKLVLASTAVKEVTEETLVRGCVPEADQHNMTFEIQFPDGRKVGAPIDPQHLEVVLEAFNGYRDGLRVLVQGIGRFNRHERLLGFLSIEHLTILEALDVSARLDDLRTLQQGWCEGAGKAPSSAGLDWLGESFNSRYPEELPLPHLYPTPEGGIQAEWSFPAADISVDIDIEERVGHWHVLNLQSDAEETRKLSLAQDDQWIWMIEQIRQYSQGK